MVLTSVFKDSGIKVDRMYLPLFNTITLNLAVQKSWINFRLHLLDCLHFTMSNRHRCDTRSSIDSYVEQPRWHLFILYRSFHSTFPTQPHDSQTHHEKPFQRPNSRSKSTSNPLIQSNSTLFKLRPLPPNQMSSQRSRGRGGSGRNNRAPLPRNVQISKKLSWLLRHGAESEGLHLDSAGFINLSDVLANRNLRSLKVSFAEVRDIVRENDKQRFTLLPIDADAGDVNGDVNWDVNGDLNGDAGVEQAALTSEDPKDYKIRANQGHSLKVESEGLLAPITADDAPRTCVHGTTHAAWISIVASGGLKPMGRNHVHFASGLPAGFKSVVDLDAADPAAPAAPVISGMRSSSTVLVFVDVAMAMEAGLKFWRSDNGVILTEGDENGLVSIKFFQRVEDRTGAGVLVDDGEVVKEAPKEWVGKGKGRAKG